MGLAVAKKGGLADGRWLCRETARDSVRVFLLSGSDRVLAVASLCADIYRRKRLELLEVIIEIVELDKQATGVRIRRAGSHQKATGSVSIVGELGSAQRSDEAVRFGD